MQEMGYAYQLMTGDMRHKLGNYMTSLEARYGDPRVYAMQRAEMDAQQAAIQYQETKSREGALVSAYSNNRERIRDEHKLRMQSRKATKATSQDKRRG